jgi:hypothetical protein
MTIKTKQEKQIVDIMQNIKLFLGLQITFRDPDIIKYNTGMIEFEWASKYQVTKEFEHHLIIGQFCFPVYCELGIRTP